MVTRRSESKRTRSQLGKTTSTPNQRKSTSKRSVLKKKAASDSTQSNAKESDIDDVDENEYEVEAILEMSTQSDGGVTTRSFLVGWVGYDEPTWEPEANIPAALVEAYLMTIDDTNMITSDHDGHGEARKSTSKLDESVNLPQATSEEFNALENSEDVDANEDGCENTSVAVGEPEYEVEAIRGMKKTTNQGVEVRNFLVAWVGYEEPSWEPEDNLPQALVSAYVSQFAPEPLNPGEVCATCGEGPGGLGSACSQCSRPMHHFCATDVCVSLSLKGANGEDIVEFPNDTCYCSKSCWERHSGAVRVSKRKRAQIDRSTISFSSDDDDDEAIPKNRKKKRNARAAREIDDSDFDDNHDSAAVDHDDDVDVKKKKKAKARAANQRNEKPVRARPHTTSATEVPDAGSEQWPPRKPKKTMEKGQPAEPTVRKDRDPVIGKMVAFCADKETWMSPKLYKEVKGLYLSGRIHRPKMAKGERRTNTDLFEVRWTVTNYQGKAYFHRIPRSKVEEGIENHKTLSGNTLNRATWKHICQVPESEAWQADEDLDDYVILDGTSDVFISPQIMPANLELVEQITKLDFQPGKRMQEPPNLFAHEDGTTETKLIKEKRHYFETASSSFFAYLPLSFWNTVVKETNQYAEPRKGKAVTLDELMRFFGIMFYMTIVDKGEYSNYWGEQAEDEIFGVDSTGFGLDKLMTLKRFQYIRKNLCFRCDVSPMELKKDPAARIRPLMNMIKHTSTKYVVLGRNVAVDESSIACRSKFGRHLIVYNSSKPTGKFHFKIYACCCATSWLMVGFRLHCASDLEDRLKDVVSAEDARNLDDRLQFSSSVRQIVLEVTRPIHNTHRVVNTDNFYTSVTLLLSLRDVGLYGRGTIRENSAHFPKAHMFAKRADEPRGSSFQGVSNTGEMIAASWMDGSAVNIISNADSSDMGVVTRLIGKEHVTFPAPRCVSEYNKHMQGVDRLDQLRAKYSLADGHSMQKWHKKLALAFIDIARVNAYVTKCMRTNPDEKPQRNQHRQFMIELASELITGRWKESVEDEGMLFADEALSTSSMSTVGSPSMRSPMAAEVCDFVMSKKQFPNATRGKRGCKVCAYEGRQWTMKTIYCTRHNICLCTNTYSMNETLRDVVCPQVEWTCWRKYHEFYLPRRVFNASGRILRSSELFQARRKLRLDAEEQTPSARQQTAEASVLSPEVDVYSPYRVASAHEGSPGAQTVSTPFSPPTLVFSPFNGARANAVLASPSNMSSLCDQDRNQVHPEGSSEERLSVADALQLYLSPREIESVPESDDYPGELSAIV